MEYTTRAGDLFWAGGPARGSAGHRRSMERVVRDCSPTTSAPSAHLRNNRTKADIGPRGAPCTSGSCNVSGQIDATTPWNDPVGFASGKEDPYLFCTDEHVAVLAVLPEVRLRLVSQRDHRLRAEPGGVVLQVDELPALPQVLGRQRVRGADARRSTTTFSASSRRGRSTGTRATSPSCSSSSAWRPRLEATFRSRTTTANLQNKFQNDISTANQLVAAFHLAMVEQASGERPFITSFDPFYGDVTQQGIIIDKNYAIQNFTTLYPADNYDQNQAAGAYLFAGIAAGIGLPIGHRERSQSVRGRSVRHLRLRLAARGLELRGDDPEHLLRSGYRSVLRSVDVDRCRRSLRQRRGWNRPEPAVFWPGLPLSLSSLGSVAMLPETSAAPTVRTEHRCLHGAVTAPGTSECSSKSTRPTSTTRTPSTSSAGRTTAATRSPSISDRNQYLLVDRDWNTATYVIVRTGTRTSPTRGRRLAVTGVSSSSCR